MFMYSLLSPYYFRNISNTSNKCPNIIPNVQTVKQCIHSSKDLGKNMLDKAKGQQRMDNPEKRTTFGHTRRRQQKNALDTTIRTQTQIT